MIFDLFHTDNTGLQYYLYSSPSHEGIRQVTVDSVL
jgi:hypothetical protein